MFTYLVPQFIPTKIPVYLFPSSLVYSPPVPPVYLFYLFPQFPNLPLPQFPNLPQSTNPQSASPPSIPLPLIPITQPQFPFPTLPYNHPHFHFTPHSRIPTSSTIPTFTHHSQFPVAPFPLQEPLWVSRQRRHEAATAAAAACPYIGCGSLCKSWKTRGQGHRVC